MSNEQTVSGFGNVVLRDIKDSSLDINIGKSLEYAEFLDAERKLEEHLSDISEENIERRFEISKKLTKAREHTESFKQGVVRLAESFSKIPINTERLRQAKEHFEAGRFREADAILKSEELTKDQENLFEEKKRAECKLDDVNAKLSNNANEFLIKAQTTALDFDNPKRFDFTCSYYEQSIESFPDFINLIQYAQFLQTHNQFSKAALYYQRALEGYAAGQDQLTMITLFSNLGILQDMKGEPDNALRSYKIVLAICQVLAKEKPLACLPYMAMTFNNLGLLQHKKDELENALRSYEMALSAYRTLAKENPQTYLPYVATTLNNLGSLQTKKNELDNALSSYIESMATYRTLAEENPQAYLPGVATTLNNLGGIQKLKDELENALMSSEKALEIYQVLAEKNPHAYLPNVAMTLNNLGILQNKKDELENALRSYEMALSAYRTLAKENPQTYLPYVATTLNNLGILQTKRNELEDALGSYKEALEIYRNFASDNPQAYLPDVAMTLNNLGSLQSDKNELKDALRSYEEVLEIRKKLAEENPQTYLPYVATTLLNLSIFYYVSVPDRDRSIRHATGVVEILTPMVEYLPYTKQHLDTAKQILEAWG